MGLSQSVLSKVLQLLLTGFRNAHIVISSLAVNRLFLTGLIKIHPNGSVA